MELKDAPRTVLAARAAKDVTAMVNLQGWKWILRPALQFQSQNTETETISRRLGLRPVANSVKQPL